MVSVAMTGDCGIELERVGSRVKISGQPASRHLPCPSWGVVIVRCELASYVHVDHGQGTLDHEWHVGSMCLNLLIKLVVDPRSEQRAIRPLLCILLDKVSEQ